MTRALSSFATLAVLLAAAALLIDQHQCLAAPGVEVEKAWEVASDCQPELPPNANSSGAPVTLQMHQWLWIENLTEPDWGPRTEETTRFLYDVLTPGVVRNGRMRLLGIKGNQTNVYVNVSYVTNGDTLCAAALTVYRNESNGTNIDTTRCSRICHANFTSLGARTNLPVLMLDDWTKLSRYTEYLAIDALDPESRASYTCMGFFRNQSIPDLPKQWNMTTTCSPGDQCMFNYDSQGDSIDAGCFQKHFAYIGWCASELEVCDYFGYKVNGDCPVCCRGDLCNRALAVRVYQKRLMANTTSVPHITTTTKRSGVTRVPSLWALAVSLLLVLRHLSH